MARTALFRQITRLIQNIPQGEPLTRREFLLGGAGVAAGLLLPTDALTKFLPAPSGDPVIIVGGGVAGLTVAYRLAQRGVACEVFEGSGRFGGRMFSRAPFNAEGMYVDLGGELVDSTHSDLMALCAELGIALGDFSTEETGLLPLFLAEGRVRSEEEMIAGFKPLAALLANDLAKLTVDGEVVVPNYLNPISDEVKKLDRTPLSAYLDSFRDRVEHWVLEIVKTAYVGEYGLEADEQSALNLLILISPDTSQGLSLFGASDESKRILGGSERLPAALVKTLKGSVPLNLSHRLDAIRDHGGNLRLVFHTPGKTREVVSNRVVMTLPFSSLRFVDGIFRLDLKPAKKHSIRRLGYGTNAKLAMGFHSRFWRQPSGTVPASNGEIFSDRGVCQFWETSRLQTGSSGILTAYFGGRGGASISTGLLVTTLRQLSHVYPQASHAFDGNHALMQWAANPFTRGSYTCARPGQFTTFLGCEGETELGGRLLFAGEHCSSDFQGFMNGSVQTANRAAASLLGTARVSLRG